MPLTLNQFLLLVLTIAAVVTVVFLVLLFIQLRKTARRGEESLIEIKQLTQNLDDAITQVKAKVDDVDQVIAATKKTASGLADITMFATTKILAPSTRFWPILAPLVRYGWRQYKKRKKQKEETNVK